MFNLESLAIVRASKSDNSDFVKLIHLTDGRSLRNGKLNGYYHVITELTWDVVQQGYLLDLHVTMVEDSEDLSEDE